PGFMVVRTDQGERLTRGGSLKLDAEGRLADAHGQLLMGEQGPIVVQGAALEVKSDGTLVVDGSVAGRLKLVTPRDRDTLLKAGAGRFAFEGALEPVVEGATRVRQGAIEEPNL